MDGNDLAIDRISDLSDKLITQILSLLKINEAVCTCVLSKRWRNLWTSMATLDLDCNLFGYKPQIKFLEFVQGVINRRGFSPLDKFKLSWCSRNTSDPGIVEECINHAIACMPRVIYISTRTHMYSFKLPDSLFNCGSVKEMTLFGNHILWKNQPNSINLPSLQKLDIGNKHMNDDMIRMLLLGCPVLEELVLTQCRLMLKNINSNVLKKLIIRTCYFPSCATSISLKNASSLVTADLDFAIAFGDPEPNKLNLLRGLPNVTSLRLNIISRHILELLGNDIPKCPILNNLKSLEFGELEKGYGWNLVACFLEHSPNLKKLILNFGHTFSRRHCGPSPNQSEVAPEVALPEHFSYQRDFLEIVEIRIKKESKETVSEVVTTLGGLVKTIGKIVIL